MVFQFPNFGLPCCQESHATQQTAPLRMSMRVVEEAGTDLGKLLASLNTHRKGLCHAQVRQRLKKFGFNQVVHEHPPIWSVQLFQAFQNPFIFVLMGLALVCYLIQDTKGATILSFTVALSGTLRFIQEFRSSQAAEKLKAMVNTKATVSRRSNTLGREQRQEIPTKYLVPGDIIHLSAGDIVPADVRLLMSKNLLVSQGTLTGESLPIEKHHKFNTVVEKLAITHRQKSQDPLDIATICFMSTHVVSGTATAVVVATGKQTYLGSLAHNIVGKRTITSFDVGINCVTWLLIGLMVVMVPIVFLISGITQGDWMAALVFSIAVAVGLTPELLPMIVTANLARGSVVMSQKKVIVKRLNAIQNLGAMDILCTDKTGTLTEDKITLDGHFDVYGELSQETLKYAYLNSYYQTGLNNHLDVAVLQHGERYGVDYSQGKYQKVDEIPFDFVRRRMSVVVQDESHQHILICKGSVEEILPLCVETQVDHKIIPLRQSLYSLTKQVANNLNVQGLRVIAVAYKAISQPQKVYQVKDEIDLTLVGYLAFLDPPKESASDAIASLQKHGVQVKVITGDHEAVAQKICQQVGLTVNQTLLGTEIEQMSDEELAKIVNSTTVFAKTSVSQKARLIRLLKHQGNTVGYLGDGINDAAALREADVGISVDTGVDVAKESADIILLEKSLLVLEQGVIQGRKTFANMMKYLKITASSNFGNVFSVIGASVLLPFLPMMPLHLLIQNLLYDISQITIPFDHVDTEYLAHPQKLVVADIGRFICFIGPISSIFDYATYGLMWFVFDANTELDASLFQSGWFIEGLLSQVLIIHIIRTGKVPWLESQASLWVILSTLIVMSIGIFIPFSNWGASIGFQPVPMSYFPWLMVILCSYCCLTQLVKVWYIRQFGRWL